MTIKMMENHKIEGLFRTEVLMMPKSQTTDHVRGKQSKRC